MKQSMRIENYEVWLHLGCTKDEQRFTQPVHFSLELHFENELAGALTDRLEDVVDYVSLMEHIKAAAEVKPYHLIEHLLHEALLKLSPWLKSKGVRGQIKLSVRKLRVPVENLKDGVIFSCETNL